MTPQNYNAIFFVYAVDLTFPKNDDTKLPITIEEGKRSHAKMLEDTLKVFEAAEGDVPMIIMNHITIEHFNRL